MSREVIVIFSLHVKPPFKSTTPVLIQERKWEICFPIPEAKATSGEEMCRINLRSSESLLPATEGAARRAQIDRAVIKKGKRIAENVSDHAEVHDQKADAGSN